MNVAEMKVEIFETVAQTHDAATITRFYEAIHEVMDEDGDDDDNSDGWSDLSSEQQKKLDAAIAQTYDPTKMVSKEEAYKMIDKWLTE
jgi:hypothetical protein